MEKHNGQITEYLVRKYSYSITNLAEQLNVNRRSIYNYFENKDLKPDVMLKIGIIIRHDFSVEFPEFFTTDDFKVTMVKQTSSRPIAYLHPKDDNLWKNKYIDLLEKHAELLVNCINKTGAYYDNP